MFAIQSFTVHTKDDTGLKQKILDHKHFESLEELEKFEEDLSDILIDKTSGEAAARFKSANDGRKPNSIVGYAKLYKWFQEASGANITSIRKQVMSPIRVKDEELVKAIEAWEKLERDLNNMIKGSPDPKDREALPWNFKFSALKGMASDKLAELMHDKDFEEHINSEKAFQDLRNYMVNYGTSKRLHELSKKVGTKDDIKMDVDDIKNQ